MVDTAIIDGQQRLVMGDGIVDRWWTPPIVLRHEMFIPKKTSIELNWEFDASTVDTKSSQNVSNCLRVECQCV